MHLNAKKTKEMILKFSKRVRSDLCDSLVYDNALIDRVDEFKILGVIMSSDLTWSRHIEYILARANKRIFAICQLVRCGFGHNDIVTVYCSLIRPVLEYASQMWHSGLTKTQSDEIERVQRRCLHIIYPQLSYSDARAVSGLQLLSVRRENAVIKLFNEIKNPSHVLHYLLPMKPSRNGSVTRDKYPFELKCGKTSRRTHSMIYYCIGKRV